MEQAGAGRLQPVFHGTLPWFGQPITVKVSLASHLLGCDASVQDKVQTEGSIEANTFNKRGHRREREMTPSLILVCERAQESLRTPTCIKSILVQTPTFIKSSYKLHTKQDIKISVPKIAPPWNRTVFDKTKWVLIKQSSFLEKLNNFLFVHNFSLVWIV
jgi:hypothetical protein